MHAAEHETRRRPYVLGLVILVHLLLAILFLSSPDPGRGGRGAALVSMGAGANTPRLLQADPAPATVTQGLRRHPFSLSIDHVGLVGASSFPPPTRRRSATSFGN